MSDVEAHQRCNQVYAFNVASSLISFSNFSALRVIKFLYHPCIFAFLLRTSNGI